MQGRKLTKLARLSLILIGLTLAAGTATSPGVDIELSPTVLGPSPPLGAGASPLRRVEERADDLSLSPEKNGGRLLDDLAEKLD